MKVTDNNNNTDSQHNLLLSEEDDELTNVDISSQEGEEDNQDNTIDLINRTEIGLQSIVAKYNNSSTPVALGIKQIVKDISNSMQTIKRDEEKIVTISILGRSGSAKSSYINALSGRRQARIGGAVPVTSKAKIYSFPTRGFSVIDHRGIFESIINENDEAVKQFIGEIGIQRPDVFLLMIDCSTFRTDEEGMYVKLFKVVEKCVKLLKDQFKQNTPVLMMFTKPDTVAINETEEDEGKKFDAIYEAKVAQLHSIDLDLVPQDSDPVVIEAAREYKDYKDNIDLLIEEEVDDQTHSIQDKSERVRRRRELIIEKRSGRDLLVLDQKRERTERVRTHFKQIYANERKTNIIEYCERVIVRSNKINKALNGISFRECTKVVVCTNDQIEFDPLINFNVSESADVIGNIIRDAEITKNVTIRKPGESHFKYKRRMIAVKIIGAFAAATAASSILPIVDIPLTQILTHQMIELLSALSNDPGKNAQSYTKTHKIIYGTLCTTRVVAQVGLLAFDLLGPFTMGLGTLIGIAASVPISTAIITTIGWHAYQYLTE